MNKLTNKTEYNKALQEFSFEFGALIFNYLQKFHHMFYEDNGLKMSHADIFKIKKDCMTICYGRLEAFYERNEEEVIQEILQYNYDREDVKHMKEVEKIDLYSHLNMLTEKCIKRSDPAWFQYGIHELLQNGKVDPGPIGSRRTQFCKCCGEQINISYEPEHGWSKA